MSDTEETVIVNDHHICHPKFEAINISTSTNWKSDLFATSAQQIKAYIKNICQKINKPKPPIIKLSLVNLNMEHKKPSLSKQFQSITNDIKSTGGKRSQITA
jgi:hypothetical protein